MVEVEVEGLNSTAGAQLVVAAHPLPYYNDVVWTVLGDTGPVQVGGGDSEDSSAVFTSSPPSDRPPPPGRGVQAGAGQ